MSNHETYAELIALAEQGHDVAESQLLSAKRREQEQSALQDERDRVAADLAAAKEQAEMNHETHDDKHLPVLADMIAELQSAEQARVDGLPEYQAAVDKQRGLESDRDAQYNAVGKYIRQNYGEEQLLRDSRLGYSSYMQFGRAVVDGQRVNRDGSLTPLD